MGKRAGKGPHFVQYFPHVLQALRELGGSARPSEVQERVAVLAKVNEEVQSEQLSSGQPRFDNQVAWARFYLAKAGLIDASQRGVWTLTETGRNQRLDHEESMKVFLNVQRQFRKDPTITDGDVLEEDLAPEGSDEKTMDYRADLLELLQSLKPDGFERFSQRLLRESGFQEVAVTGRSGDGGIDGIGILQVNSLVSFKVLFQCKRYKGVVTPSQVRDFRGAMQGRADKGVVITTGSFTSEAKKEAVRDGVPPIELIDGERLIHMLEDLKLGLVPVQTFRVDEKFFQEYRD